ncbi:MAG: PfkB family carbohydrate kinase [Micrococcales bacterium]|nr:PfkB family carbohydrate kinase [Micrococcales bacterium]
MEPTDAAVVLPRSPVDLRVAVAGHLCLDLTPRLSGIERVDPGRLFEVGPLSVRLGGSVANTGGDLVDLGLPVILVATVGDDPLGELLRQTVDARPGMSARLRTVPGAATSYSLVFETPHSDRTFWHHVGGNAHFDGTEVEEVIGWASGISQARRTIDRETGEPRADGLDLLHIGYPNLLPALVADGGEPLRATLQRARERGALTSLDLAVIDPESETGQLDWEAILRRVLPETDILTPSIEDLTSALRIADPVDDALVERLADQLLQWGAGLVALTVGTRGVFLAGADEERLRAVRSRVAFDSRAWANLRVWAPPYLVQDIVTTTGAGDAATAGFLYGVLTGMDPQHCGTMAMACAAAIVSGRRTTPPVLAQICACDSLFNGGRAASTTGI